MTTRASVVGRAITRGRVGYLALSLGPVGALIVASAVPLLAAVLVGGILLVVAGGAAWDAAVLVGLGIDVVRRRRGRGPIHVGVDYGSGKDIWFETAPAEDPYRSQDERRLLARGDPAAAARRVGGALAMRLAVVTAVMTALALASLRSTRCHHNCRGSARTACNTIRQATQMWKAVNPEKGCPTLEALKADRVLDTGFNLRDPWGGKYQLRCVDDEIVCMSAGPDRKRGTDDDVVVPDGERDGAAPDDAPAVLHSQRPALERDVPPAPRLRRARGLGVPLPGASAIR
jgi:hypothetical protein